jgi:hypothetical protein
LSIDDKPMAAENVRPFWRSSWALRSRCSIVLGEVPLTEEQDSQEPVDIAFVDVTEGLLFLLEVLVKRGPEPDLEIGIPALQLLERGVRPDVVGIEDERRFDEPAEKSVKR